MHSSLRPCSPVCLLAFPLPACCPPPPHCSQHRPQDTQQQLPEVCEQDEPGGADPGGQQGTWWCGGVGWDSAAGGVQQRWKLHVAACLVKVCTRSQALVYVPLLYTAAAAVTAAGEGGAADSRSLGRRIQHPAAAAAGALGVGRGVRLFPGAAAPRSSRGGAVGQRLYRWAYPAAYRVYPLSTTAH